MSNSGLLDALGGLRSYVAGSGIAGNRAGGSAGVGDKVGEVALVVALELVW